MRRPLQALLLLAVSFAALSDQIGGVKTASDVQPKAVAEIRFETAFGGIVFFPAQVNSSQLQFLLDTGGAGSSIDRELANTLGVTIERAQASVSGNDALEVGLIREASIKIGPTDLNGQLIAAPLAPLEPIFGRRLDGILGGNFMKQHVVELDFENNVMRLYSPSEFQYTGRGSELPFSLVSGIPFVELQVVMPNGRSARGNFLIDTGGNMTVHIYRKVAETKLLLERLTTLPETGYGIGGATTRVAARGLTLSIGQYHFKRPIVVFSDDTAGLRANPDSLGLVGMEVLRRFKVTFDYSRGRMYLEPNGRLDQPFVYDASGLRLRATRPSFSPPFVAGVIDSSPASEAGIERGDVLLEIDGQDMAGVSLEAVRTLLRKTNKAYNLTLSRGEKRLTVKLRTRDILN